ncbi:hypothetical protein V5799_021408 [Amblyomma americanum]|uniref:non-specific serine/threonine protein kinase n=1 Tax=Amblyomma americanum TaxID=6943 RepID=A0AAQ4FNI9_AMBAM
MFELKVPRKISTDDTGIVLKPKDEEQTEQEDTLLLDLTSKEKEQVVSEASDEFKIVLQQPQGEEEEIEIVEYVAITTYITEEEDGLDLEEGEHVILVERKSEEIWLVRKTITKEKGLVPKSILQDVASYNRLLDQVLEEKISKIPAFGKLRPGEKMTAPKFLKKPEPTEVEKGQPATFKCTVQGNPRPYVTWFKQTRIIKSTTEFEIYYDEDNVSTLVINEVFPEDAGTYTVVAKNPAGFASCSADLTVQEFISEQTISRRTVSRSSSLLDILVEGIPPVFSAPLRPHLRVDEGSTLTLVIKVTGTPEPDVTLKVNDKPLNEKDDKRFSVVKTQEDHNFINVTFVLKDVKPSDEGTYEVMAENSEGSVTSHIDVEVIEKPKEEQEPPKFTQTFSDTVVTEEETVRLIVKYTGKPPPTVLWYRNDKPIPKDSTKIITREDESTSTLEIPKSEVADTASYTCTASNPAGKVTHTAKVTVQEPNLEFVEKLQDIEVKENHVAMFVTKTNRPVDHVTWCKDGEPIKLDEPHDKYQAISEGPYQKLVIKNSSIKDEGEYTCVLGDQETSADLVVIELPPEITTFMTDQTVAKDDTAQFFIELTKGDALVRWFKDGKELQFSDRVRLKIDGKRQVLIIKNSVRQDAGRYTCKVGDQSCSARLTVEPPSVEFTARLPEKTTVPQDTDAIFEVALSRADVDVVWMKNGKPIPMDQRFKFVKEEKVRRLVVPCVDKEDTAEYTCVAGNVKTSTILHVEDADAEFTLRLHDVIVRESDTVTLLVEVSRETLEVRWMKDGDTIHPSEKVLVTTEGKSRKLIIRESSIDDQGVYSCVLKDKKCSSSVVVHAPPKITTSKENFSTRKGTTLKLPIPYTGIPQPTATWKLNGQPLEPVKNKIIQEISPQEATLTIKDLQQADTGTVTLTLKNSCGECSKPFTVTCIETPSAPGTPEPSDISSSGSLTLSWKPPKSDGGSKITNYIIEYHDRNTLRWILYSDTVQDTFTKVEGLSPDEEYMFRVTAENEAGKGDPSPGTKYIRIQPKAGEPPVILEHLTDKVVGIKKPAELTCRISGNPTPTVKWLKNGKDLVMISNFSAEFKDQKAVLRIKEASTKSGGKYTCKATNPHGSTETTCTLSVQDPPRAEFDEKLRNVRINKQDEFKVPCTIHGFPKPTVAWFHDGVPLQSTKHTLITEKDDTSTITIHSAEGPDSGIYTIELKNTAGSISYDFKLRVLDKPGPPQEPIQFLETAGDHITLSWQPPLDDGGSPLTKYIIEHCETTRTVFIEVGTTQPDTPSFKDPDVTEGNEYLYRISAVNEYGTSAPLTSEPVVARCPYDKPSAPEGPLTTAKMTDTSLVLTWKEPLSDGGRPIIDYTIEKREASKKAWIKVGTTESLSMEVTNLKSDNAYMFRVTCRNEIGSSPPLTSEEPITVHAQIQPPDAPTGPLRISDVTNKTATLTWSPPAFDGGSPIVAYIVEHLSEDQAAVDPPKWATVANVDGGTTTHRVISLSDKTRHRFRVCAENVAGVGPPLEDTGEWQTLPAAADRPTPPTAPLEILVTGPNSMDVSWGRPEWDGGSPLLGYTAALRDTSRTMWMEVGQVDAETLRLHVKDLEEGAQYHVRILARNDVGFSDPLESEEPVTILRPPGFQDQATTSPEKKPKAKAEETSEDSYTTQTTSSWIREANVEPLLHSYTKHVLVSRNEYFFRLWHYADTLFK